MCACTLYALHVYCRCIQLHIYIYIIYAKKTSIYVYVLYIYELPTRGESEFETFPNDRFSDLTM